MTRAPEEDRRRRIVAIVGPTAVGKTSIAMRVAEEIGGEIVSADSRQIYRGMNIGTAKPTPDELSRVRHHLIDIVDPSEIYDAVRFARDAEAAIGRLITSGIEPFVVGGTGFYVASLFDGIFEGPGRDDDVRSELKARLAAGGPPELHEELAAVDPASATRIHPNDASRIIRALEVYLSTGRTLSSWQADGNRAPAYAARTFSLTMPRETLYARIEERVDAMVEAGFLEEVRALVAEGRLATGMPAASAVGYRELLPVVEADAGVAAGEEGDAGGGDAEARGDDGETRAADGRNLHDAVLEIKRNTRRFAKRQLTWLRSLEDAIPIDVGELGVEGSAREILSRMPARSDSS